MNQARVSPAARDQLINQIIHQGKAKRSTLATDTYSRSLSVKEIQASARAGVEGQTTQPIPRGGRSEVARPSKAQDPYFAKESTDSISAGPIEQRRPTQREIWNCKGSGYRNRYTALND